MPVLDSSVLIELLNNGKRAAKVLAVADDDPAATTSIAMHEVLSGARSERQRFVLEGLFSSMRVLPHDARAARASSRIEQQLTRAGTKVNAADMLIAGICIANSMELLTLDHDFEKIEGVRAKVIG